MEFLNCFHMFNVLKGLKIIDLAFEVFLHLALTLVVFSLFFLILSYGLFHLPKDN